MSWYTLWMNRTPTPSFKRVSMAFWHPKTPSVVFCIQNEVQFHILALRGKDGGHPSMPMFQSQTSCSRQFLRFGVIFDAFFPFRPSRVSFLAAKKSYGKLPSKRVRWIDVDASSNAFRSGMPLSSNDTDLVTERGRRLLPFGYKSDSEFDMRALSKIWRPRFWIIRSSRKVEARARTRDWTRALSPATATSYTWNTSKSSTCVLLCRPGRPFKLSRGLSAGVLHTTEYFPFSSTCLSSPPVS